MKVANPGEWQQICECTSLTFRPPCSCCFGFVWLFYRSRSGWLGVKLTSTTRGALGEFPVLPLRQYRRGPHLVNGKPCQQGKPLTPHRFGLAGANGFRSLCYPLASCSVLLNKGLDGLGKVTWTCSPSKRRLLCAALGPSAFVQLR